MIVDIHSHVLPGIDDGAKTMQETFRLLRMLKKQGVEGVVATPHFYPKYDDLDAHLEKAEGVYKKICDQLGDNLFVPRIFLGHEVRYFRGISESETIHKLKISGTNKILIEMSYDGISTHMLDDILSIQYNLGLTPIIAHIDRYVEFEGFDKALEILKEHEIKAQINADSVLGSNKKQAFKMLNDGLISYIGSDTHSIEARPPQIDAFMKKAFRKVDEKVVKRLEYNSECLFNEMCEVDRINAY
ncbi:MAG: CpsB/CapC family capsule biosynthesis tyrosine phosphatase [Oscillospiraceae bacterium]